MPRPKIDYEKRISLIPDHAVPLPAEAGVPRRHHEIAANDSWALLVYVERNLKRVNVYQAASERHVRRLNSMVLLSLVEAFERFIKELAAVCIDHVGSLVLDDRLAVFNVKGGAFASHFAGGSVGQSLCESSTWVDCGQVNDRFRRILADPFAAGSFYVFPSKTQGPPTLRNRFDLVETIWQLRHSIVHNAGVITRSDALKFRLLTKHAVQGDRLLWPTRGDVWYVKLFLDETVELINREVGSRLGELLSTIRQRDASLFDPAEKAQELADRFRESIIIAGVHRDPLPP